ncbi:Gfo/Idh/MocA family oxidoreductase [Marinobacter panjinensis]|uniref:Gfo/Idh/MocA family oxidoreductase n=1 Tax=Marinobacter panjinensis TaxID=2576384 RepID=A0A4U6R4R7_9GAMM|nr:Gfo/Idh/MocA family oxidoreductase [Marinobacter panjinensis]MCR8915742.1 Gfo/Idh/MocA family oxidoreductase [Marinobacter panjinensis]TKV67276.1 Gfo/Idh/MocA family oxidoreductase [Marinobacter panjinensis]
MQTEEQLTVAIVGAGLMGNWHAHAAQKNGAVIAAVIDSSAQAANKLVGRYGGRAFSDFEQALEQTHFDVVHICTPLKTHVLFAKQALTAEKHVIVEKPVAPTRSELNDLQELAASKNLLLCPVHQFAFQRGVASARKELARRTSGPLAVSFDFASAGGLGREAHELNQILVEILPHPLSILSELWPEAPLEQEPLFVDNPRDGELFTHSHHQGFPVTVKLSLNARPTHCSMTIDHEQGAIHLNLFHGFAVFESPAVSRIRKIMAPFALSLNTLIAATRNLSERALNREPAYPGLRTLIHQCYRSVQHSTPGPISRENTLAVATIAELVESKLSHATTTQMEQGG